MIVSGNTRVSSRVALGVMLGCIYMLTACTQSSLAAGGSSRCPAGATRPAFRVHAGQMVGATGAPRSPEKRGRMAVVHPSSKRAKKPRKKSQGPVLHGDPARALLAFNAMQKNYYLLGSGLYKGEPFSFLWPFSQAFAATVSMANISALRSTLTRELKARVIGLHSYLDLDNAGAVEGTYTSTLAAFDGTAAPPDGPGGAKYYDDNDWVGIELVRLYKLDHEPAVLGSAEGIMAFEMAGWQANPELGCAGGLPFSNAVENTDRNPITTAPAAELAVQLYRVTGNAEYLQFATMAYEWV